MIFIIAWWCLKWAEKEQDKSLSHKSPRTSSSFISSVEWDESHSVTAREGNTQGTLPASHFTHWIPRQQWVLRSGTWNRNTDWQISLINQCMETWKPFIWILFSLMETILHSSVLNLPWCSFALYDFNKNLKGPSCVSGFTQNIYTFSKTFPEPHGQPSLSRPFQL